MKSSPVIAAMILAIFAECSLAQFWCQDSKDNTLCYSGIQVSGCNGRSCNAFGNNCDYCDFNKQGYVGDLPEYKAMQAWCDKLKGTIGQPSIVYPNRKCNTFKNGN
ncbi:hypothetical protein CPC16_003586 [Podila verticillata]|nr:hypothetical protein CPC16_003586 [Podila verticillata]